MLNERIICVEERGVREREREKTVWMREREGWVCGGRGGRNG